MSQREPLQENTLLEFPQGSCRVEALLGSGANALVYLGSRSGKTVLIKELFPLEPQGNIFRDSQGCIQVSESAQALWDSHRQHFLDGNEIHSRLLLDHPELTVDAQCYPCRNTLYTVVDFPGGKTLGQALSESVLDLRSHTQRMLKLLDALEAVHKCGFLHLDIRPETIMLAETEQIFLMDYNSTIPVDYQTSSYLNYRPGYSAPEVEYSASGAADFSSDLYSVTAVFYHCLMGRRLSLEEMLLSRPPDGQDSPLVCGMHPAIRRSVKTILRKGMSVLSTKRYRSVGQMRKAFRELLELIDNPAACEAAEEQYNTAVVTALPRRRRPLLR